MIVLFEAILYSGIFFPVVYRCEKTHPRIYPMSAPGLHTCLTFIRHQFRPSRSVFYNPAKTRRVVAHASVTFCNTRQRLSISFGRVSHQASPSRHTPSSTHPVTGYGFSQEIQKYPKTEVLQDVTPTPPSTFPYLQQALKPSCKSPQSPRKAHQHPPPSYTPGSA